MGFVGPCQWIRSLLWMQYIFVFVKKLWYYFGKLCKTSCLKLPVFEKIIIRNGENEKQGILTFT